MSSIRRTGRFWAIGGLLLLTGLLAACNTIQGVGRDIRAAGNAIEGAANDAKR